MMNRKVIIVMYIHIKNKFIFTENENNNVGVRTDKNIKKEFKKKMKEIRTEMSEKGSKSYCYFLNIDLKRKIFYC